MADATVPAGALRTTQSVLKAERRIRRLRAKQRYDEQVRALRYDIDHRRAQLDAEYAERHRKIAQRLRSEREVIDLDIDQRWQIAVRRGS